MSVKRVRRRRRGPKRVRIGVADPSLTGLSGVAAVAEFAGKLDLVGTLDRGIGPIKWRDRGASGGQVLVAVAQSQLLGADGLVGLDRQRLDPAMTWLSAVPALPATTAAGLARRFTDERRRGVESAVAALTDRHYQMLRAKRGFELTGRATIDMDSTDVQVYGSRKQGCGLQLCRATVRTPAPGDLGRSRPDPCGGVAGRQRRRPPAGRGPAGTGLAALPPAVRFAAAAADRLRVRADAGYFTAELAHAAVTPGCDFAIAAKRNTAMWRAYASIPQNAWVDGIDMPGAQIAAVDCAPAGWPEHTDTIVGRVRLHR